MGEEDALDRVQVVVASEEVGVEAEGGKFLVKAAKKVVEVVEAEVVSDHLTLLPSKDQQRCDNLLSYNMLIGSFIHDCT